jgi:hypothetical protein
MTKITKSYRRTWQPQTQIEPRERQEPTPIRAAPKMTAPKGRLNRK